jgi:hypothetical protein
MLPTHRNMKKGEYINDDKYMKSKRSSKVSLSSCLLILSINNK